jgi:hypothetical protein
LTASKRLKFSIEPVNRSRNPNNILAEFFYSSFFASTRNVGFCCAEKIRPSLDQRRRGVDSICAPPSVVQQFSLRRVGRLDSLDRPDCSVELHAGEGLLGLFQTATRDGNARRAGGLDSRMSMSTETGPQICTE